MSMIGEYRRITLGQLYDLQDALRDNPDAVGDFLYSEERIYDEANPELQIAKSWHGIDFLLYGKKDGSPSPLNIVMGGTEIGEDLGYGPARSLASEQVKEAKNALDHLDKVELRGRFDPAAFEAADISPGGWLVGEPEKAFGWLWDNITKVHAFFTDAAYFGDAMLLYLS